MKSLEVAKTLEKCFAGREARRLDVNGGVVRLEHGPNSAFVVCDASLSRRILTSNCFASYNYFHEGLTRLEVSGRPASCMKEFFEQGPLFHEGQAHRAAKREFKKLLDEQCDYLRRMSPRLATFMAKRSRAINSAVAFSELFTRLCVGLVVSRLTSAPLTESMRVLRKRENLFHFHFHPFRHLRTNALLERFNKAARHQSGDEQSSAARMLAHGFIIMGHDPLLGALCAALVEGDEDFSTAPARYCPTSFVSRLCREKIVMSERCFREGDICYLSLVPAAADRETQSTFPFGLGTHTCVGRQFSLSVLSIAQDLARELHPGGFSRSPVARGNGAFLGFGEANERQDRQL